MRKLIFVFTSALVIALAIPPAPSIAAEHVLESIKQRNKQLFEKARKDHLEHLSENNPEFPDDQIAPYEDALWGTTEQGRNDGRGSRPVVAAGYEREEKGRLVNFPGPSDGQPFYIKAKDGMLSCKVEQSAGNNVHKTGFIKAAYSAPALQSTPDIDLISRVLFSFGDGLKGNGTNAQPLIKVSLGGDPLKVTTTAVATRVGLPFARAVDQPSRTEHQRYMQRLAQLRQQFRLNDPKQSVQGPNSEQQNLDDGQVPQRAPQDERPQPCQNGLFNDCSGQ